MTISSSSGSYPPNLVNFFFFLFDINNSFIVLLSKLKIEPKSLICSIQPYQTYPLRIPRDRIILEMKFMF